MTTQRHHVINAVAVGISIALCERFCSTELGSHAEEVCFDTEAFEDPGHLGGLLPPRLLLEGFSSMWWSMVCSPVLVGPCGFLLNPGG